MANREFGLDIEEKSVDLFKGEHKSPAFVALNPNGKKPVLEYDDGSTLWESNAIVNRLAAMNETALWPKSDLRYDIMRWQFWESCHFAPAVSKFLAKHVFGDDSIDMEAAQTEFDRVAGALDGHLADRDWLVGDGMTTAEISIVSFLGYRDRCQYPVDGYPNITRWLANVEALASWKAVNLEPEAA